MSYHIYIKKNQTVTYKQVIESKALPSGVQVAFNDNLDLPLESYSKFYLTNKSTRGVALTVSDNEYDVELNIGASKDDYLLAANISIALAEINNSLILPEFDYECSIDNFRRKYDESWADANKVLGIDALKTMVMQNGTMKLPCCVRPYYFGHYMIDKLSRSAGSEESFANSFIESIRQIQFIENLIPDLEIPTLLEGDFPEGVKQLIVILPEFKLLIQKCDYIILRIDTQILRVEFDRFIAIASNRLERLDELQYILNPIDKDDFIKLIAQINVPEETATPSVSNENDSKRNWWQFWKK